MLRESLRARRTFRHGEEHCGTTGLRQHRRSGGTHRYHCWSSLQAGHLNPVNAFEHWTVRYLTALAVAKRAPPSLKSLTITTAAGSPVGRLSAIAGIVGAIETLTKSLTVEIASVRVNCIALGAFEALLTALVTGSKAGSAFLQQHLQRQVTSRIGQPEEAAEAYLYLMRDSFRNGCISAVKGGRHVK